MKTPTLLAVLLASAASAEILTLVHPDEALPKKSTVVWSPLFQATWDKLNAELGGKPDKVAPPNELMTRLDSFSWKPDAVMPEGSWKTWSGPATADFLKRVNAEAAAMTQQSEGPFSLSFEDPANRAAFGLLDREVSFQKEFVRSRKEPLTFHANGMETPVHFFGSRGEMSGELRDHVQVLAFRPADHSHAIRISCKEADDSVILFLPPNPMDFATACLWLRTWRARANPDEAEYGSWNDPRLHDEDDVRIPYVSLDANADLTPQLQGNRFFGKNSWSIGRAEQLTRFQLHEKGARVHVEASIEAIPLSDVQGPRIVPRKFLYDRPFFILLWRDGAEWPYFGAWIGDSSALNPAGS